VTTGTILGLVSAALGAIVFLIRLVIAGRIKRQTRRQVEAEVREEKLKGYKETRERVDAVDTSFHVDRTADLREWLRERGGKS